MNKKQLLKKARRLTEKIKKVCGEECIFILNSNVTDSAFIKNIVVVGGFFENCSHLNNCTVDLKKEKASKNNIFIKQI